MNFEYILTQTGNFRTYQIILLFGFLIPASILSLLESNVFYLYLTPDHWCSVKQLVNFSHGEQHRFIRPIKVLNSIRKRRIFLLDSCSMHDINYDQVARLLQLPFEYRIHNINNKTGKLMIKLPYKQCQNGWVYDRTTIQQTAVTQFDLVCQNRGQIKQISFERKLASQFGLLFFGLTSDRFGRKTCYLLILVTLLVSQAVVLIFNDLISFRISQIIIGFTVPANQLAILVLCTEMVGTSHRIKVSLFMWCSLVTGQLIEALVLKHIIINWTLITLTYFIITMMFLSLNKFLPESPVWLTSKQDYKAACEVVEQMMKLNNKKIISNDLLLLQLKKINRKIITEESMESKKTDSMINYFRNSKLRIVWSILVLCFVINLLAEGIFKNLKQIKLNDDQYVNYVYNSLTDLPAIILACYFMERRIGRRFSNCCSLIITGIALIMLSFTDFTMEYFNDDDGETFGKLIQPPNNFTSEIIIPGEKLKTEIIAFLLLGKLANQASMIISYQQAIELNPTTLRTGSIATILTVANAIALAINYLNSPFANSKFWLIILSIVSLIVTVLASFLTETLNENLPFDIQSAEKLITEMKFNSLAKMSYEKVNLPITISKWNIYQQTIDGQVT